LATAFSPGGAVGVHAFQKPGLGSQYEWFHASGGFEREHPKVPWSWFMEPSLCLKISLEANLFKSKKSFFDMLLITHV
jgi:hypothetical protein